MRVATILEQTSRSGALPPVIAITFDDSDSPTDITVLKTTLVVIKHVPIRKPDDGVTLGATLGTYPQVVGYYHATEIFTTYMIARAETYQYGRIGYGDAYIAAGVAMGDTVLVVAA